jgi:hypothetical protein
MFTDAFTLSKLEEIRHRHSVQIVQPVDGFGNTRCVRILGSLDGRLLRDVNRRSSPFRALLGAETIAEARTIRPTVIARAKLTLGRAKVAWGSTHRRGARTIWAAIGHRLSASFHFRPTVHHGFRSTLGHRFGPTLDDRLLTAGHRCGRWRSQGRCGRGRGNFHRCLDGSRGSFESRCRGRNRSRFDRLADDPFTNDRFRGGSALDALGVGHGCYLRK